MLRALAPLLLLAPTLTACMQGDLGPAESTIGLQITPAQDVFRWGDDPGEGLTVEGTLANTGELSYYAQLGDGFNAADEQELLYVAEGSDAWLERREGSSWVPVERPYLVEGTKVVTLREGGAYRLVASLPNRETTGTFRFRVVVRVNEDGTGSGLEAVSPSFKIE